MNRVPNAEHSKCVCDVGYGEYVLQCQVCPTGSVKTAMGDFPCVFCGINEYAASASEPCRPCPHTRSAGPGRRRAPATRPSCGAARNACSARTTSTGPASPPRCATPRTSGSARPWRVSAVSTNSFGNASVHMPSGLVHCRCESGSAAVPRLPANMSFGNETAPAVNHLLACAPCAAGQFEASGVCLACPRTAAARRARRAPARACAPARRRPTRATARASTARARGCAPTRRPRAPPVRPGRTSRPSRHRATRTRAPRARAGRSSRQRARPSARRAPA